MQFPYRGYFDVNRSYFVCKEDSKSDLTIHCLKVPKNNNKILIGMSSLSDQHPEWDIIQRFDKPNVWYVFFTDNCILYFPNGKVEVPAVEDTEAIEFMELQIKDHGGEYIRSVDDSNK